MEINQISSSNRVEGDTADHNNSAACGGSVSPAGQASSAPTDVHDAHVDGRLSPPSSSRSSSRFEDDDRPLRLRRDRSRSHSSQRNAKRGASKRQRSRSHRDSSFSSRSPRSAVSPSSSSCSSTSRNSHRRSRSTSRSSSRRRSPSSSSSISSSDSQDRRGKGGDGDEREAYMGTDADERRKARNRRKREKRREKRRADDRRKRHPRTATNSNDAIASVRGLGEKLMPIVIGAFGGQYAVSPQTADGRHIHHQHGGFAHAAPINPWCVPESSIEVAALLSSIDAARTNNIDSDTISNLTASPRCIVVPHNLPLAQTTFLDLVAVHVAAGGPAVEDEVKIREAHNPYFAFLHANWQDPAAIYYRWRLYSLLQGDTLMNWRTKPFIMETMGGADRTSTNEEGDKAPSMPHVWIPPPMPVAVARPATSESPVSLAASTIHASTTSAPLIVTEAEAMHATRPNVRSLLSVLRTPESASTSSAPPPSSATQILLALKRERLAAIEVLRGGTRTLEAATRSVLSSNNKSSPDPSQKELSKTGASTGRGGGALSSLLEDAFLVPDLPLAPRGAQSRQQQQAQKSSVSNRPPSDDLLEITCEEAEALLAAFYPSQQPHNIQQIKTDKSGSVTLAYLPTAPVMCSASAPFFLLEVGSQNNSTPSSPSAVVASGAVGGRGAPVFTPAASASAPTAGWLASSLMQREKAFFPFLAAKDESLLRGTSLPLLTSEDGMAYPLTSCATVNFNTLGRVRSACMLYMLRRSKRYARTSHRDGAHTTIDLTEGKGATAGMTSVSTTRLESYEALVTGSDVKKLVQQLMTDAPDVSVPIEEVDEILRLREAINSRLAAYLLLSPQKRETVGGSSVGVSPLSFQSCTFDSTDATDTLAPPPAFPTRTSQSAQPLISLIDIISYVFAAFGHLFAADDLPRSAADYNDNTNNPEEEAALQALANTQRFHSVLLQRALLDKAYIGELAALLLRHHRCAQHALSILLDEAVQVSQLPAELMQLIAFLSGSAVLKSPEAKRISAILDRARAARTNTSTSDDTSTANVCVMGQQLDLSASLLQAIPHRIASMHTYALQSLLFVLNDLVFMANAPSSNSTSINNNNNNPESKNSGGSAWVDLVDVPPTAASPSGAAIADVLAKSAPPPLSATALPPTALSSMVASYKAASDRRHHQAVAKAISALSSPHLQVMAAVEMIIPSIVEVFSSYALAVGALTGSIADGLVVSPNEGQANHTSNTHYEGYGAPPSLASSISQIPNLQPVSLRCQSVSPMGDIAAMDAFLASQLVQWLRTLLFEWYQRRYYNTRRYQALVMKAAFLSQ